MSGQPIKILVVDDELGMRMGVTRALSRFSVELPQVDDKQHGFDVIQADSGEEGLRRIRADKPDIVLLDIKMSGKSGLEVLKELQREDHDILVVMITAYATIETAITATKRGAYDVLPKPFTPDELKVVVRKAARHLLARRKAAALAAEKRQVRFQFISVLAHELKSPLAAIEGYLNIMNDRTLGGDLESYDNVVERTLIRAEGMRKLIYDLLDLTRLESGQKRRELGQVDLREVVERSVETVQPMADERKITVTVDAPDTIPLTADAGELEIVLNNLVSNAVKYNRDEGTVDVKVTVEGDDAEKRVTLAVSDTGIGMTPEESQRLFNEFVRIKNAKTRGILGSGLGLSIMKKIAELYDGTVSVESEAGVGSTFTVTLVCPAGPENPANG